MLKFLDSEGGILYMMANFGQAEGGKVVKEAIKP